MFKQFRRQLLPVCGLFVVIVEFFLFLNSAHSQSIPTTLGWYQLPNTSLRTVCPPNGFGGSSYSFTAYCNGVTAAWNGGVFDSNRNRLIIWGGGHNDYYGNEVYALDLNNLTMSRITNPGLPIATSCSETIAGNQPNSRHTYNGLSYMANVGRMFVNGGSLSCSTSSRSTATWTFDLANNQWQNMNPSGTIPDYWEGRISDFDPNTGKVFVHDTIQMSSYSPQTNSFTRHTNSYGGIDYHMTGVVDPVRKRFYAFGGNQQWMWDISSGSAGARHPRGPRSRCRRRRERAL